MDTSTPPSPKPSSPTHIDSIPNEVLHEALLLAVLSSPDTRQILPTLPLVCRRWAEQVRGSQALKSHITLNFAGERTVFGAGSKQERLSSLLRVVDNFFAQRPQGAEPGSLVLKLAFNDGLEHFHYSDPGTFISTCGVDGQLQLATVSKIREAALCLDPVVALSFFMDFPQPQVRPLATWTHLTTLQLTSTWGDRMPIDLQATVIPHGQLVTSMPQLKNLMLTSHTIAMWFRFIPWGQLEVLDLRICIAHMEDLLRIFHQCEKSLQRFHLRVSHALDSGNLVGYRPSRRARYEALRCFELVVGTCVVQGGDENGVEVSLVPHHN